MANLFITLERLNPSQGQDGLPAWFSTHPNPPDRINAIRQAARQWQESNPQAQLNTNRDQYLMHLEGLIIGEDPRQGYVEGQIFYHPLLRFQFPIPAGWQVNNTPSQVQIFTQEQDAVILLSASGESTPEAAANLFISDIQAVVVSSEARRVNGLPAHRVVCDLATEQGLIRVLACFIQKDNLVYSFIAYTAQEQFDSYLPAFDTTIGQFRNLTDAAKINVKPQRLALRRASGQGNLRQSLQSYGVPQDKLEAHAILNGMELDDPLPAGMLIKIAVR
jgi:predicted Zn-dependent protease